MKITFFLMFVFVCVCVHTIVLSSFKKRRKKKKKKKRHTIMHDGALLGLYA